MEVEEFFFEKMVNFTENVFCAKRISKKLVRVHLDGSFVRYEWKNGELEGFFVTIVTI
jgi:hypothetical protein